MIKYILQISTLAFGATSAFGAVADAIVSDKLKSIWNDPAVQARIENGIKHNRMGDFILVFNKPVENLKIEQVKHDFLFGCNAFLINSFRDADNNPIPADDKKYEDTFVSLFNFATIPFYWKHLEPEKGKYRFDKNSEYIYRRPPPDVVLEFCKKNDIVAKGHCLVWAVNVIWGTPQWAIAPQDADILERYTNERLAAIAARYKDQIMIWDVVNEACYYREREAIVPKDHVFRAFKECERLFPTDSVFINNEVNEAFDDYFKVDEGSRFFLQSQSLIARGAKVDVLGLQFHIFNEKRWEDILAGNIEKPEDFFKALDGYSTLGRPIHITEITIPTLGKTPEESQAFFIEQMYKLWFSHKAVEAITWWNLVDGTAAGSEDKWRGGLVNRDFSPKLAYKVLDKLINHDWRTSLDFKGKIVKAHFLGFYGKYKITFTVDGKEHSTVRNFGKKAVKRQEIRIK